MKKIVLIGGYGHSDIGDESQLTAVLTNLKNFLQPVQFFVLSDNPEHTRDYHKVHTIAYPRELAFKLRKGPRRLEFLMKALILVFNAWRLKKGKPSLFLSERGKRLFQEIKSANLLFNVGGGNLTSVWPGGLYSRCMMYILFDLFGKPIVLSGQTIGPFYGWFDKRLASFALSRVNVITLRERFSYNVLQRIGVTKPLIVVTADDSIALSPAGKKEVEKLFSEEKILRHHPLIAANMIRLPILPPEKLKKGKQLLAEIADHLISTYNARIVFVPMQYARNADDRIAASEVLKLMKHKNKVSIIMREYDDRTLKGVIEKMDLAIGFRYHFIVFAVSTGVPSIGIYLDDYYSVKIKGILELMGQGKYVCDIEKTTLKDLTNLVNDALSNEERIRRGFNERTKQLQDRSLLSIRCAANLIGEDTSSV